MSWPLPALLGWALCWLVYAVSRLGLDASIVLGFSAATGLGACLALRASTPWRRVFVAAGFPLSFVASGFATSFGPAVAPAFSAALPWPSSARVTVLPAWIWLVPLLLLWLAYPRKAWRDAPYFPTPRGALSGLAALVPLPARAQILDAGCGLGAGLAALRREYPQARLCGLEWSWPLRLVCAGLQRDAHIARADIWTVSWSAYDLVYLFQRPESLARALDKASREMRPGAWLASLEFAADGVAPSHRLDGADGRPLWLYRMPVVRAGAPRRR